jgi:hypothetical protein
VPPTETQYRIAPRPGGGTVSIPISESDRLLVVRELSGRPLYGVDAEGQVVVAMRVTAGWLELFKLREGGAPWERILDEAARRRPGVTLEEVREGLGRIYAEVDSRLHAMAFRRASLLA